MKIRALFAAILVAVLAAGALTHADAAPGHRNIVSTPAAAAACTQHFNLESDVNWSASSSVIVYSNAAWSRSLWTWDTCNGGIKFVFSFDTDCHLRAREWLMNTAGATTTYRGVVGDRGGTCNARPGRAQWQQSNGSFATWSAAGTKLSYTPYTSASPYKWRLYLAGCDGGEQVLNTYNGQYFDFWFSPRWNFC